MSHIYCHEPLVSICIPVYNHARFVQACIRSVISQTYRNIELLVIDDGSTDYTWSRIQELRSECEKRFVRVLFKTRENRGHSATLRELFEMSRGSFVGEIASDDMYLPGAVSQLVLPFLNNDAIGFVAGMNLLVDDEGKRCYWDSGRRCVYDDSKAVFKTFDEWLSHRYRINFCGDEFGRYDRLLHGNHIPNGGLFRRSMICFDNMFSSNAPLEDWWLHLQLSKTSKYKYVSKETFCYRWHGLNTALHKRNMMNMARKTLLQEMKCVDLCTAKEWRSIFFREVPFYKLFLFATCPFWLLWGLCRAKAFFRGIN